MEKTETLLAYLIGAVVFFGLLCSWELHSIAKAVKRYLPDQD